MGDASGITPKRGEVFLVNFDQTIGSEIQKTRPALIIQNDIGNRYSPVSIVAAITSFDGAKIYPTEVKLEAREGGLDHDSIVLLNQLRSIDKQRLVLKLGALNERRMEEVAAALLVSLGLVE
jgi:mRNA interferase MazF